MLTVLLKYIVVVMHLLIRVCNDCTLCIGLPNVGKSSVINSLKRRKTCGVGACPGVTKSVIFIIIVALSC